MTPARAGGPGPAIRAAPLVLALLLPGVAPLGAQAPAFEPARLVLGTDSMTISMVREGTLIAAGMLWDELTLVPLPGGGQGIRRVYRTVNRLFGNHLDTTVATVPALAIVARRSLSRILTDSVVAVGDSLLGWESMYGAPVREVRRHLPAGTIDSEHFDLLVRTHPWAPGARFAVRAFLSGQDSLSTLTATYGGEEILRQRDGTETATWRIEATFASLTVTFWVDQRTRAMVKEVIVISPEIRMLMVR